MKKEKPQPKPIFVPFGKWILVRLPEEKSHLSVHGIFAPAKVDQMQQTIGIVEAVGPEVKLPIKKGDSVAYPAFAGEPFEYNEEIDKTKYRLLLEEDIPGGIKYKS